SPECTGHRARSRPAAAHHARRHASRRHTPPAADPASALLPEPRYPRQATAASVILVDIHIQQSAGDRIILQLDNPAIPGDQFQLVDVPTIIAFQLGAEKRSEEHTSELQSRENLVCRLLLEKKKKKHENNQDSIHNIV